MMGDPPFTPQIVISGWTTDIWAFLHAFLNGTQCIRYGKVHYFALQLECLNLKNIKNTILQ